ncbi:mycofactocin-coupled SDR family oxidoreductase [Rhodococcus sp. ZPP]|uniref:SDR family mycofactocin-dependent oxidoreductase n=1 Tax=Rhodococcus opacus TaxID=37919 RepID=A0A2S8JEJ0_RHOOP|nr:MULTISPECIES: mycofactocin-coupled SDR family oxidoreductase [Rhodococcus]PQP25425.1 SDR family mycofactocin-dependent oxidoreductase [Rhodococcus opacus]QTJ67636.1 mycofactocin-coupled SDR family oxidoreductase [Rhodococcus sp. ZPP]
MTSLDGLDGKVAVITGGARGQGRSHALTLAGAGAKIVVCDIAAPIDEVQYALATSDDLEETIQLVKEAGGEIAGMQADVRSSADMRAVADLAVSQFGRIDILLANAGIHDHAESTIEIEDDAWQTMLDVNLTGAWKACKAVVPAMIEGGRGGSIVITSSVDGLGASPSWGHYGAAKHGLQGLKDTLAFELADYNIRVNTVNPTGVNSPMAAGLSKVLPHVVRKWKHNDRTNLLDVMMLEPQDISDAVLWLVSDAAKYVTGIDLPIDAGYLTKH